MADSLDSQLSMSPSAVLTLVVSAVIFPALMVTLVSSAVHLPSRVEMDESCCVSLVSISPHLLSRASMSASAVSMSLSACVTLLVRAVRLASVEDRPDCSVEIDDSALVILSLRASTSDPSDVIFVVCPETVVCSAEMLP